MKKARGFALLFLICGALAWALTDLPLGAPSAMVSEEAGLLAERASLEERISELERELIEVERESELTNIGIAGLKSALRAADQLGGMFDMTGPGVEVILSDARPEVRGDNAAWSIVHDVDVLRVINALLSAGAECVAVNDVRILANTRVRCGGPTIHVRDRRLTPPFIITAIGDPAALERVLNESGETQPGLKNEFAAFGLTFGVTKKDNVIVKRSLSGRAFQFAKADDR